MPTLFQHDACCGKDFLYPVTSLYQISGWYRLIMKVRVQMAIDIFLALATLDVCSVNLILRTKPLKIPQTMWPADPARCSSPRTIRSHDHADSEHSVLPTTLFTIRTLQIP